METPRTVAGQAAISAMRPYVKRALGRTIVAIEEEAIVPYQEALRQADNVLGWLAAKDATSAWDEPFRLDVVERAGAAREAITSLLLPLG